MGYSPWGRKEPDTTEGLTGHLTDDEVLFRIYKQPPESSKRTREEGNYKNYTNGQCREKQRRPAIRQRGSATGVMGRAVRPTGR